MSVIFISSPVTMRETLAREVRVQSRNSKIKVKVQKIKVKVKVKIKIKVKVKVPTLFSQRTRKEGRGTRICFKQSFALLPRAPPANPSRSASSYPRHPARHIPGRHWCRSRRRIRRGYRRPWHRAGR